MNTPSLITPDHDLYMLDDLWLNFFTLTALLLGPQPSFFILRTSLLSFLGVHVLVDFLPSLPPPDHSPCILLLDPVVQHNPKDGCWLCLACGYAFADHLSKWSGPHPCPCQSLPPSLFAFTNQMHILSVCLYQSLIYICRSWYIFPHPSSLHLFLSLIYFSQGPGLQSGCMHVHWIQHSSVWHSWAGHG